jgi:FemAB-related protein (PEP-CTERM system-associated)
VLGCAGASPYHLGAVARLAETVFGFRCHFLTARDAQRRISGVLPLVEQPGLSFRRKLVSLPFFNYGGAVSESDAVIASLAHHAERIALERGVGKIELRHLQPHPALSHPVTLDKVTMVLELPSTADESWRGFDGKLRSQIRRAERESPEVRIGSAELLADFYGVFCSVMRDLGTPVYPQRFFRSVLQSCGDRATLVVIYLDSMPVAGAFLVRWREGMEIPWAATINRVKRLSVNMRLYWEVLQYAIRGGCRVFDFGRSTVDGGTYRFKQQWGAKPIQLHWQHWSRAGETPQTRAEEHGNLDFAVKLWQRLPLPIANWLGPSISPRLPW